MKKNLVIFMLAAFSAVAFSACSPQSPSETAPSSQPAANAGTESASEAGVSEESNESGEETTEANAVSADNSSESETAAEGNGGKAPETSKVKTKVLNKTGKKIDNINIITDSGVIGLGSVDDSKSTSREIESNVKDAKIEFSIEDDVTRLPLENGFQGFKVVINADGKDGFFLDYVGIDEAD